MRRIFILIVCCLLLTTVVQAAGSVTNLQSNTVFASDGTCEISVAMQITTDGTEDSLHFPLPNEARDISLNGSGAKTFRSKGLRWVDLSKVIHGPGSYPITIHYALPDLIVSEKGKLTLTLPLLSGFDYPIDHMEFTVTLPGEPEERPFFSSTYHPESMDLYASYTIDGPVISGFFTQDLKDHESLTMTLPVSDTLFPQPIVKRWSLSDDDIARYGLTILALLYWILFLRAPLPKRVRQVQPTDSITAGELGCCLIGQGVDFSMMVLSWAQMGYLTIQLDRHHRVLLHKNMDMGNERSEFEVRCFKTLFGARHKVDGSTEHYARLGRKAARTISRASLYFRKSSGSPMIFRCLAAGIGAFGGLSFAMAFATDTVWQVILSLLLVPLGAVLSWVIQAGARGLQLRHKYTQLFAAVASFLWFVLGNWAGEGNVALYVIISQILAGVFSAYGSRRTEAGIQSRNDIIGLRRYLKSIPPEELERILQNNPDYYFTMAPYAVALGVGKKFSHQFGNRKLSACPYLITNVDSATAQQWNDILQQIVRILDERQYKQLIEKILGK